MTNKITLESVFDRFAVAGESEAIGENAKPDAIQYAVAAAMQGAVNLSHAEECFNRYILSKARRLQTDTVEGLVTESTRKKSVSEFGAYLKGACAGVILAGFPYDELIRIARDAAESPEGRLAARDKKLSVWAVMTMLARRLNENKIEVSCELDDPREGREHAIKLAMIRLIGDDKPADDKPAKVKDEEKLYAELIKLAEGIRDGKSPSDKSPGREPFPSEAINQIIAIAKTRAAGLAAAASTGTRAENYHSMVAFASRRAT